MGIQHEVASFVWIVASEVCVVAALVVIIALNYIVPPGSFGLAAVLTVHITVYSDTVAFFIPDIEYGGFCFRVPGDYIGIIGPAIDFVVIFHIRKKGVENIVAGGVLVIAFEALV